MSGLEQGARRARLVPGGMALGDEVVPLLAGTMHYWRNDPVYWRAGLEAVRSLGLRMVDTYVPWSAHETAAGDFDFGDRKPWRNVVRFLELVGELGLYAIVRPGPHCNAEMTFFGIPERVVWDPDCQARSAKGSPVVLPVAPLAFPVPSYASRAFHTEIAQWFDAVGTELAPLQWPDGPIVMLQVDNESALYFRDGVYDQDYHPDAIAAYRQFVQERYQHLATLREAYREPEATFAKLDPPRHLDAVPADRAAPHLDWAEFQERMVADSLTRMREALVRAGFDRLPTSQNLPIAEVSTPLDPGGLGRAVDLVGLDYYGFASEKTRGEIAYRTTALAVRSEASGYPAFGCEMGAGFPPFLPSLTAEDNAFGVMTALAYGLRGYNVYMAVERDRWIGAPIDPKGRRRPEADFWERLTRAIARTRFHSLHRSAPVRIVVPRSFRRLERVLHAFGPASAAGLRVVGYDAREACFEDELGPDGPDVFSTTGFLQELRRALDDRGVPYAVTAGDLVDVALRDAAWVVVLCTGSLERSIVDRLGDPSSDDAVVTIGPREPRWDASMLPFGSGKVPPPERFGSSSSTPRIPGRVGPSAEKVDDAVDAAIRGLSLPIFRTRNGRLHVTRHDDADGRARVLFVINAGDDPVDDSIETQGWTRAEDVLDGTTFECPGDAMTLSIPARTVRMLSVE